MVEEDHPRLSIVRQCELVSISRSSHYYTGKGESTLNLKLMRLLDAQFLSTPWYGRGRWRVTCGGRASVLAASGFAD